MTSISAVTRWEPARHDTKRLFPAGALTADTTMTNTSLSRDITPAAPDENCIAVRIDGTMRPIRMRGQPIYEFYPGWQPFALHVSLLSTPILRMRNESGQEAYWILDGSLDYLASCLDDLPDSEREGMVRAIAPFFLSLTQQTLSAIRPVEPQKMDSVRNLGRQLCEELLREWLERSPPPGCLTPPMLPQNGITFSADRPPLPAATLVQLLETAKGLANRAMPVILSPHGSLVLRGYRVLDDPDLVLMRFADPNAGDVFYAGLVRLAPELDDSHGIAVLYCPQMNLILSERPAEQAATIPFRLLARFISDPDAIGKAPAEPVMKFGLSDVAGKGFTLGAASSLPTSLPEFPGRTSTAMGADSSEDIPPAELSDEFSTHHRLPPADAP